MKKRLASLVLLLVLVGGAFAGVPLHFGEQSSCSMGMEGMECCVMALLQNQTAEAAAAKLCCALNCAQSGTTSPPNIVRVTPPLPTDISAHPALTGTLSNSLLVRRRFEREHGPPIDSQPAYIRHLALLI